MNYKSLLCLLLIGSSTIANKSTCEFSVIIPSYNNEAYVEENLDSICFQTSTNPYHIYYVNDVSTDRTRECVENYIKKHKLENKVTLINNEVNIGGGANIFHTIYNHIADHKIVVLLDGDDALVDNDVLITLEKYYDDPDTWMTHGRYRKVPSGQEFGHAVPSRAYRDKTIRERARITHLKTFRAALYKKVKLEDHLYNGEFPKVTWDTAFILPMVEMCAPTTKDGKSHCVFTPEVFYLYRCDNPLNDHRINRDDQMSLDWYFRHKKEPYLPLESLEYAIPA